MIPQDASRRLTARLFPPLAALLVAAAAAAWVGCSDDDEPAVSDNPCDPNYPAMYTMDGAGILGPAGGEVAVKDTSDFLGGVKVRVAPGTWDSCWEVAIWYSSIFSTEDYPDGFVPFQRPWPTGSVEIELGRWSETTVYTPPDSILMDLCFPLTKLPCGETEMYAAYYYDEAGASWRVVLPDQMDETELVVRTRNYTPQWSWGRVDLSEIDYQRYMEPALTRRIGAPGWQRLVATTDSLYDAATDGRWRLDCSALAFARGVCVGFRDYASARIGVLQAGMGCGTCDIREQAFFDGLRQYVWLNLEAMVLDMFVDAIPGRLWVLKLAGMAYVFALEAMARSLPCDYECYVSKVNPVLIANLAAYYAAMLVIEGIDLFKAQGYIHCP